MRREELIELTHLSVRQYQRPNGEVVALLVISPSKSDRERVVPMSAELFHVIAQVIRRHTARHGTVRSAPSTTSTSGPGASRFPYLFQRTQSGTPRALSISGVRQVVVRAARRLVPTHPTAVRALGLVTASVAQPGWMAGIPGPLPLPSPEQLPEMGACGAVGVARQRRTPGDFVVLCYAGS